MALRTERIAFSDVVVFSIDRPAVEAAVGAFAESVAKTHPIAVEIKWFADTKTVDA